MSESIGTASPSAAATEARAVATWNAALAALPDSAGFVAGARQSLIDAGMVVHGVEAVHVARPVLLSAERCRQDQAAVDAVTAALWAAADLALADRSVSEAYLGDWLDGSPLEPLMRVDPGYATPIVFGRFDGARVAGDLRIIEFNGGLPGGATPSDVIPAVMAGWGPGRALAEEFTVGRLRVAEALAGAVFQAWTEFGGTGAPFVVVAAPTEVAGMLSAGLGHLLRVAAVAGVEVEVAPPGDLVHQDGRLRLAGRPVDVLVRAFPTSMMPQLGDRVQGIADALVAGDLCVVTSFRSGLLGNKALFAMVTDPSVDLGLADDVIAAARACLPWTRLLADAETTHPEGGRAALLDLARRERARLVLKPVSGYGGAGVTLGWECAAAEWETALVTALSAGSWIVQERVHLEVEEFPALVEGLPMRAYTGDINPIVCGGRVSGYFTRLAASGGITNVSSGDGSATGVLLVS